MYLEEIILNYDFNGVKKSIYEKYGYNEIINIVLSILEKSSNEKSQSNEHFFIALTFILDSYIFSDFNKKEKTNFKMVLKKNCFFDNISKYLYHEYNIIKHNTITRIGKFSISTNVKYLENAYIRSYYKNNPVLAATCLFEMKWLKSKKYNGFIRKLEKETNLINIITLGSHYTLNQYNEKRMKRLLNKCKNTFFQLFYDIDYEKFLNILENFDLFSTNIQYSNNIKEWNRYDYEKIIKYYIINYLEIYKNNKIDYIELYENIYNNIKNGA